MAIQNFLSGGFYGKLGDVVGQRWHNKRVIRSHVIPANPRTELQQSNRALFALATSLAQQAYNINKGSPLWDTSRIGQFSQLVGTAKRRLQAGMSPAQALPLYPDGYIPNIILSQPSAQFSGAWDFVIISDSSYIFPETRSMMVIISARDEVLQKNVLIDDDITIQAGSTFSYTFYQSERYSMPQGSSVTAVTVDDSSFSSGSITLPKFDLQQVYEPLIVFRQGWSDFTQVPGSNDLIMQVPGMPPLVSNFFGAKIHLWRVSSSSFVDEYFTFAGSGSDVWSVLIPSSSGFTLPVGSFVHESSHLPGDLTPTAFFQIWFPQRSVQFP